MGSNIDIVVSNIRIQLYSEPRTWGAVHAIITGWMLGHGIWVTDAFLWKMNIVMWGLDCPFFLIACNGVATLWAPEHLRLEAPSDVNDNGYEPAARSFSLWQSLCGWVERFGIGLCQVQQVFAWNELNDGYQLIMMRMFVAVWWSGDWWVVCRQMSRDFASSFKYSTYKWYWIYLGTLCSVEFSQDPTRFTLTRKL